MKLLDINKAETVCFTGYRPHKMPNSGDENSVAMMKIKSDTALMIKQMIAKGKTNFINGLMMGFDIIAAEQVIRLKEEFPYIKCTTVAPFSIRYFEKNNWTEDWKKRALAVCKYSDNGISLSEHYRSGIYYERNRYMVNHSSEVIAYYDGQPGGTRYTIEYAKANGVLINNICIVESR